MGVAAGLVAGGGEAGQDLLDMVAAARQEDYLHLRAADVYVTRQAVVQDLDDIRAGVADDAR